MIRTSVKITLASAVVFLADLLAHAVFGFHIEGPFVGLVLYAGIRGAWGAYVYAMIAKTRGGKHSGPYN